MGETDDLRSVVDALLERVRILEDQLALAQVVASYGPAVDSGSSERTASLWSDDGVFDVPPYATWAGRDEIAGMVDGVGHQALITNGCGHVLTAPRVVVDGDDARGWNYALNIRWDAAREQFWIARLSANEWIFRRQPDGWKTVRRTNVNLDGNEKARAIFRGAGDA